MMLGFLGAQLRPERTTIDGPFDVDWQSGGRRLTEANMFANYTQDARRAIFFARYEASQFGYREITAEHLLLGLFKADRPLTKHFLPGDREETIRNQIGQRTPPREFISTSVDLPLSEEGKRVLKYSTDEADRLGHTHIGTGHLLLGLLGEKKSFSAEILRQSGVDYSRARVEIARMERTRRRVPETQNLEPEEIALAWGSAWGAGYYRKAQSDWRKFYWEKRGCEPRDALVHRESHRTYLYSGQPYDSVQFDLVKGGWRRCHCVICWRDLLQDRDREHTEAYTNGQDWLCAKCYEIFVESGS